MSKSSLSLHKGFNRLLILAANGLLLVALALLIIKPGSFFVHSGIAATYGPVLAFGVDTVAGYEALLSTSPTQPSAGVEFLVKKPSGAVIVIPATTNGSGVAEAQLYDYHTRAAGTYQVAAALKDLLKNSGAQAQGKSSTFQVYADELSLTDSLLTAHKAVARGNGRDSVEVYVDLKDKYGNAFAGHEVRLISSRARDVISPEHGGAYTNSEGRATFTVASDENGVSTFSALDATSSKVLAARSEVAFLDSGASLQDSGGDLTSFLPIAAAQGMVNKLEIGDLPAQIQPNQTVSFRVTAQDQDGGTVQNYTGAIHFSVSGGNGSNVTLPQDYTFESGDQGTHVFGTALRFTTAGTYTLVATDIAKQAVKGEKQIVVGSGSGSNGTGSQNGQSTLVLLAPTAGTYSENVVAMSGTVAAGTMVKFFDNDAEIGQVQASPAGTFSFQAGPLADGAHSLYAVTVDGNDTVVHTSDTVAIMVDTSAPTVDEVRLSPDGPVSGGSMVNVEVLSESALSQAALIFNQDIIELSPGLQPNTYTGSVVAPPNPGQYSMDVLLIDELGNEATYQGLASVTVSTGAAAGTTTDSGTSGDGWQPSNDGLEGNGGRPSQVFGLIGYGSNHRVTLVWEAATDDTIVDHYRVYFGLDPLNLDEKVDTIDASTTWYVPNLENGSEYFFALTAVDDLGAESELRSEIVSGIPFTLEVQSSLPDRPMAALGAGGQDALLHGASLGEIPPEMVKNGPEVLWLLVGTSVFGNIARRLSKGLSKGKKGTGMRG